MNEIIGNSPVKGRSQYLNRAFEKWWYFLNSLGVFSFLIAIDIHGDDYQQGKAIASSILLAWMFIIGRRISWPKIISNIRKQDKTLAKKIDADYLSYKTIMTAYFPFIFGYTYLVCIALNILN